MPQTHTIQRQTIEIVVADAGAAQKLRRQADLWCRGQMMPLLDGLFSSLVEEEHVLQIDRLEVDLVIGSPDRFEADFGPGVAQALRRMLEKIVTGYSPPRAADRHDDIPVEEQSSSPSARAISFKPQAAAHKEMFFHFLDTGRLPWWAPPEEAEHLDAWLHQAVSALSGADATRLRALLSSPRVRRRVCYQFTQEALCGMIAALFQEERRRVGVMLAEAVKAGDAGFALSRPADASMTDFWDAILSRASQAPYDRSPLHVLIDRAVSEWVGHHQPDGSGAGDDAMPDPVRSPARTRDRRPGNAAENSPVSQVDWRSATGRGANTEADGSAPAPANYLITANDEQRQTGGASESSSETAGRDVVLPGSTPVGQDRFRRPADGIDHEVGASHAPIEALDHALPVRNAGLVLLWPYLGRFYQGLKLADNHGFVSTAAACRAVHLLHYLAFGKAEAAEPGLLLNKILCGLPVDTPVPRRIKPSDMEIAECQALLQAVIDHWQALKNTTIHGLQTAFLQRFGLIDRTQTGWRMRVERSAYDLLLDRLPWGIAVVRLSWMRQALMVDW